MGKRELIALLNLSSWCLVMVERLFLTVPRGCLQFVIVVFPDHTHLLFFTDPSKAVLPLWIIFGYLYYVFIAAFRSPAGKDWLLGSLVCEVLLCFASFPCGVLGQV